MRPQRRTAADYADPNDELERRIIELGQEGCGRAEIAVALGLNLVSLKELEALRPDVTWALAEAAKARVAWWGGQIGEMLKVRFDPALWAVEYRRRYPDALMPWESEAPAAAAEAAEPYQRRWRRGGFY